MARTEVTGSQIKDASVSLTADVTGTLPVANGGTGSTTVALNNVVLGNGTGAFQAVAPGTSGNILASNGTTWTSTTSNVKLDNPVITTGVQLSGINSAYVLHDCGYLAPVTAGAYSNIASNNDLVLRADKANVVVTVLNSTGAIKFATGDIDTEKMKIANDGSVTIGGNPAGVKVAVPSTSSSAGKPGQWAANSSYIYAYTGDGITHSWVRASAVSW